jgi:hypothetical protein
MARNFDMKVRVRLSQAHKIPPSTWAVSIEKDEQDHGILWLLNGHEDPGFGNLQWGYGLPACFRQHSPEGSAWDVAEGRTGDGIDPCDPVRAEIDNPEGVPDKAHAPGTLEFSRAGSVSPEGEHLPGLCEPDNARDLRIQGPTPTGGIGNKLFDSSEMTGGRVEPKDVGDLFLGLGAESSTSQSDQCNHHQNRTNHRLFSYRSVF